MGAVGREHGAQRFRLGFTPGELVREYGLLIDLLLELLADKGLQLSLEEVRQLTNLVATVTAEAVEEHARQQAHSRREEGAAHQPRRHRFPGEEERARLDAAFLQAPVAIGIIRGHQMVIDLANPQFCRFCGRLPEQVVGKPLLEALPELEGVGLDELIHEVMTTGVAFVAKEQVVRLARGTDGALETAYFNIVYDVLRDERGHIEGVITVATEVTEGVLARQQVEILLRRTQESEQARSAMMDALAAQTLVAVSYLRGPDHVFETANPVYRQMVGRDVVGMKALEALPELASQGFPPT
ncbi:PAS domain-containing protein [Cystobacter fuscus]